MLKKIKRWLWNRFLPMWAKETLLKENQSLRLQVAELQEKLDAKDAYIQGLMVGIKSQRRIVINTMEERK